MDKIHAISVLSKLNNKEHSKFTEFATNFEEIYSSLGVTEDTVSLELPERLSSDFYFSDTNSIQWKYIKLNFYLLNKINDILETSENELLSVQQTKSIKNCLKTLVEIGVYSRLLPNLPFHIQPLNGEPETSDIFLNYNILKCTSYGLYNYLKKPNLRVLILPECLKAIILAFYQISFCPLKPPDTNTNPLLTQEIYKKLQKEKEIFRQLLDRMNENIHPAMFVKETMIIFQETSPVWFKRAVSQQLTNILLSKNGVESITLTMLDGVLDDTTKTWKTVDIVIKLIMSCKKLPDFKENICKQVSKLLEKTSDSGQICLLYERIFVILTKSCYTEDAEFSKNVFLRQKISFFLYFTYNGHQFQNSDSMTEHIVQNVRLIHSIFVDTNMLSIVTIPIEFIRPILIVFFRLYCFLRNSNTFESTKSELRDILVKYLTCHLDESIDIFDCFLFGIVNDSKKMLPFRNDLVLKIENNRVTPEYKDHVVTYAVSENGEALQSLLKNNTDLLVKFFGYLLNCITNNDKYFKRVNDELLSLESEVMNEFFERNLTVYKLLSDLAANKNIQSQIIENPDDIIKYIQNVVLRILEGGTHKLTDYENEGYQSLFTIVMILQSLVSNCSEKTNLEKFQTLVEPLTYIKEECSNKELRDILKDILKSLSSDSSSTRSGKDKSKTKLDIVLEDICDPLLPVRGHGLMELAKLIENKDPNAMERKQYILNIFQQNLKNDDSYIYLGAIGGLVAMANVFPDTVVRVLCDEFGDFAKKSEEDGHEVRLKVGEALVRVSKLLGEMAPKYKSSLLNAFLVGSKDDDDLVRASSLSNLGEICRVLGFKLGTVVSEVLVCVHSVIATDKSQQARRAAVTVIRQLFVGLDSEIIVFLKEDILPIYRTLKQIYNSDRDEVMRLQAQLALEQLNETMRDFVFPKAPVNFEKKIIMLD